MIAWYASSHSFRKVVDYYSYTTAYAVVGIASLISSEHNYQDDSCTNHSLVTWPVCFRPDLNPDLLRGRQVLIPLCHPTGVSIPQVQRGVTITETNCSFHKYGKYWLKMIRYIISSSQLKATMKCQMAMILVPNKF